MLNLISLLESELGYIEVAEVVRMFGRDQALAQISAAVELGLVEVTSALWGIDLGEDAFLENAFVQLPGAVC